MNKVLLMGRLTKDPAITSTQNGEHTIARYNLAVDRPAAKGDQKTDFISCVAWDKKAEFAEKHLKKGTKIAIEGRIQTGNYDDKDGKKVYTTDIVVEAHYFCESKATNTTPAPQTDADGFMNIPDGLEDAGLPF